MLESLEPGAKERELIQSRLDNLEVLRSEGLDPYLTTRFDQNAHASELAERYELLESGQNRDEKRYSVAGRVLSMRRQGKVTFVDIADRTGRFQLFFREQDIGIKHHRALRAIDRGDFLGAEGQVFRTRSGELSLWVECYQILCKAILPFPDKWHGLVDIEKRYRQRYLDLAANPNVLQSFLRRSSLVSAMRRFIDKKGFFEVETPTLLNLAGGASARPFFTHVNALNVEMSLRIATELYLKRLIVGGMERVYEIGRIFRNEGIDRTHNPEFTMLELYAAYWSVFEMMEFNEELLAFLVEDLHGTDRIAFAGNSISFQRPFARISYLDCFERFGGISRSELLSYQPCVELQRAHGLPPSPTHAHALDKLFERIVEPRLADPTFVYDYPVILSPLAKRKRGDPDLTERYELFCSSMELANAFSELNDPDDQYRRFQQQIAEREAGDDEVPLPDMDFITALAHGMPPTAGIGIGVDRLAMLLLDCDSIRDVILFPMQRPLVFESLVDFSGTFADTISTRYTISILANHFQPTSSTSGPPIPTLRVEIPDSPRFAIPQTAGWPSSSPLQPDNQSGDPS